LHEKRVNEKVAIVTGGAQGIGQGICLRLAEEGARVAIFDMNLEEARKTAQEIERAGGTALTLKVDVTKSAEVEAAVKQVVSKFGKVDILVNNAGVAVSSSVSKMSEETWDKVQDVNLKGAFLCCRAVIPYMKERRSGKIVNIASIAALRGGIGLAHYSASKAGLVALTQGLAMELGHRNINVNAVGPGIISTSLLEQMTSPELREHFKSNIPLRRIGVPRDIADAVLFLVSDEASYITGQCLYVCGGMSANAGLT
jgi:3-oxoacyl-[acyl-carrier protein] reductase